PIVFIQLRVDGIFYIVVGKIYAQSQVKFFFIQVYAHTLRYRKRLREILLPPYHAYITTVAKIIGQVYTTAFPFWIFERKTQCKKCIGTIITVQFCVARYLYRAIYATIIYNFILRGTEADISRNNPEGEYIEGVITNIKVVVKLLVKIWI